MLIYKDINYSQTQFETQMYSMSKALIPLHKPFTLYFTLLYINKNIIRQLLPF